MFDIFKDIFSTGFLLRHALDATLVLGATAPVAGCFLLLRRATFLGVALPQVSAAGMACGMVAVAHTGMQGHGAPAVAEHGGGAAGLAGAALAVAAALAVLAWLERRSGTGAADARHGALYALAGATMTLVLVADPCTEHGFTSLLSGDLVSVGRGEFAMSAGVLVPAAVALLLFRREFLGAGADGAFMAAAGWRVGRWNALLLALVGALVCSAMHLAGPLVCLGAMLLPALSARALAWSMGAFFLLAPLLGVVGAFAGFVVAYWQDFPAGVTIVAMHGVVLAAAGVVSLLRRRSTTATAR
ncbi:MAG: metal ABC transporter permease [Puniceicoccales bacterium]|jgi:zinc transport system permease protein|nr:metal ABC transporter permease [Puniceicoccales bacterium]